MNISKKKKNCSYTAGHVLPCNWDHDSTSTTLSHSLSLSHIYIYIYILGVSTGQSELGLCPTCNRPAYIGRTVERPAADCKRPWVESDRSASVLSYNHQIFAGSKLKTTTSSPKLCKNHWI